MGDAFDPGGNDVTDDVTNDVAKNHLDLISVQDLNSKNIASSNHVESFAGEASPTPIYDDDFRGHATSHHDEDESAESPQSCWPLLFERAAPR